MVYKRYIDDPNFRDNLEAILERLEAQETTSPLELGASIMQAYSHTRFNYTGPGPRKVDTSGVSYAAWVSVAELSASKSSGARRLHQECRLRVL